MDGSLQSALKLFSHAISPLIFQIFSCALQSFYSGFIGRLIFSQPYIVYLIIKFGIDHDHFFRPQTIALGFFSIHDKGTDNQIMRNRTDKFRIVPFFKYFFLSFSNIFIYIKDCEKLPSCGRFLSIVCSPVINIQHFCISCN